MTTAWMLARQVEGQLDRVMNGRGDALHIMDGHVLVIAVSNTRRAVKMAIKNIDHQTAAEQLRTVLERFDAAYPGVTDARDMLEHFDEYSLGKGNRQQPGVSRSKRTTDMLVGDLYRISYDYAHPESGPQAIRVADVVISFEGLASAVGMLPHHIWAAAKTAAGQPIDIQTMDAFLGYDHDQMVAGRA